MKKIAIASVAVLALGIGAASAAEPGEDAYFHERGNINAAEMRGPAPSLDGAQHYGYAPQGYAQGPLGYAPATDYDDDFYD